MINQLQYPRKPYIVDNGFITSLSTKFSKDYGRLWENFVFWQLVKNNEEVFYYKDRQGNEVDFVVFDNGKVESLYQACYDLTDFETREREIKSLKRTGKKLGCQNLFLITKEKPNNFIKNKEVGVITKERFYLWST